MNVTEYIDSKREEHLNELFEFLRIPSVSAQTVMVGSGIERWNCVFMTRPFLAAMTTFGCQARVKGL